MFNFKINRFNITAPSREDAEKIAGVLENGPARRIIMVYDDGSINTIKIPDDSSVEFYCQDEYSITRVGKVKSGIGRQIISAACNNFDKSKEQAEKQRIITLNNTALSEKASDKIIADFDSKIPDESVNIFQAVMMRLCGGGKANRARMYIQITDTVKPQNWFAILQWFATNVLDVRTTDSNFQLRKAFITTCVKMGQRDIKTGNILHQIREENTDDFWDKYKDKK